jgi:hypothetical protein
MAAQKATRMRRQLSMVYAADATLRQRLGSASLTPDWDLDSNQDPGHR